MQISSAALANWKREKSTFVRLWNKWPYQRLRFLECPTSQPTSRQKAEEQRGDDCGLRQCLSGCWPSQMGLWNLRRTTPSLVLWSLLWRHACPPRSCPSAPPSLAAQWTLWWHQDWRVLQAFLQRAILLDKGHFRKLSPDIIKALKKHHLSRHSQRCGRSARDWWWVQGKSKRGRRGWKGGSPSLAKARNQLRGPKTISVIYVTIQKPVSCGPPFLREGRPYLSVIWEPRQMIITETQIALSNTQIDSIQCLNFAQNWFNSMFEFCPKLIPFNSTFNSKFNIQFKIVSIQWIIHSIRTQG